MTSIPIKTARTLACLAVGMLLAVALAQATSTEPSKVGRGLGFAYDQAKEISVTGTVQSLVAKPARGTPLGLHVLVTVDGKNVDAHFGPYFSKQNKEALHAGEPVQIIGVNEKIHGKTFLLARQVVFGGRQVTIRNQRGFLIRPAAHHKVVDNRHAANGGAQ